MEPTHRQCSECGESIDHKTWKSKTCTSKCSRLRFNRLRCKRRKMKTGERYCEICGTDISDLDLRSVICLSPSCRLERKHENMKRCLAKKEVREPAKPKTRNCEICGTDISSLHWQHKICKKPECKEARNKKYNEAHWSTRTTKRRSKAATRARIETEERRREDAVMVQKYNGRKCERCGKKLKGNYRQVCPDCMEIRNRFAGRTDNDFIYGGGSAIESHGIIEGAM